MRPAVQFLAVLCAVAFAVTLCGCGGSDSPQGPPLATGEVGARSPRSSSAQAAPSKIAFNDWVGAGKRRAVHIFTMYPDGTGVEQLTSGKDVRNYDQSWSPDGQYMCFMHKASEGNTKVLYKMNADGSNWQQLTFGEEGADDWAAWSPLGDRIAFSRASGAYGRRQICVLDLSDLSVTALTPYGWSTFQEDYCPSWSRDGSMIVFASSPSEGGQCLYVVPSTTEGAPHDPTLVLEGGRWPDWCPVTDAAGNDMIAYGGPYGGNCDIWAVTVDGDGQVTGEPVQLTDTPSAHDTCPTWSPDGQYIAFYCDSDHILKVNVATKQAEELAEADFFPPDWSPPLGGGPNLPPVAADDGYSVEQNTTLNVPAPGVLDNDSDPNGDPLTAFLVSDVSYGTLMLDPDGSFSYTPGARFLGTDSFTYVANDGELDSNLATVTITVNEPGATGSVSGTISYSGGGEVANAQVTLLQDGGTVQKTRSDSNGEYTFTDVPAGDDYQVKAKQKNLVGESGAFSVVAGVTTVVDVTIQ